MVRLADLEPVSNTPIDLLFASVQLPPDGRRREVLYCGWDPQGKPRVIKTNLNNRELLTDGARQDLETNPAAAFPYPTEIASFTPSVIEFREIGQPVDNRDTRTQFVEDLLTVAGVDQSGAVQFVQIEELDMMEAVLNGEMKTRFGGETSYTLFVPDMNTRQLQFILFSPEDRSSNEYTYRKFLLRIIKSLVTLDRNQRPPDQKGYMSTIKGIVRGLQQKAQRQKIEPEGIEKIALDLGILQEVEEGDRNYLGELSVFQYRFVIGELKKAAEATFQRGRG